ncbi:biotin transporter BioY [Mariniluteicoccus endophyticus]
MHRRSTATDLALVAVFAALITAFSLVPGFDIGPVPITLQTLGVATAGLCLGPLRGFLATLLYLVLGFVGLPVFAKFTSGIGVLAKPSAGYLLSFPIAAAIAGGLAYLFIRRGGPRYVWLFLAGLAASFIIVHPMGIAGLMVNAHMPFAKAFATDLGFWIGDVLKNLAAAAIAVSVHKAFPALLRGDTVRDPEPAGA